MAGGDPLGQETADVLGRLIRFKTVNPPGRRARGQRVARSATSRTRASRSSSTGAEPERANLVARLRGEEDGPALGYLAHVDTVLADPDDWTHDPWSGDVHDGFLWGRGAIDMKSQTAAEVAAAAHLARSGWRPPRGELKIIAVVDEEAGGALGRPVAHRGAPRPRPRRLARQRGRRRVMPYGDRRLYGVCCAEKGTFRFRVRARGTAGHASVPGTGDNALLKLAPVLERLGERPPGYDAHRGAARAARGARRGPRRPRGGRRRHRAPSSRGWPRWSSRRCGSRRRRRASSPRRRSTSSPPAPSCTSTAACRRAWTATRRCAASASCVGRRRPRARVPRAGRRQRSPIESPLMDAIGSWVAENDPGGEVVPAVLPAFTDSRHFRAAFPDCVAYGFFPQRHQSLYETWPLIHAADERIDVRDLGFAAAFFADLPRRLLGMTERRSCASAAWRCATACWSTARRTGPPPCATPTARRVASGRKPRAARRRRRPRRARRRPARRGVRGHPARQARAARGAAAVPGPGVLGVAAAASLGGRAAAPPRRAAPAARRRAA